jgi:hypothetical protein
MTDSQFETLRQELRALRSDFDQRFDNVQHRFDTIESRFETRFDSVETRLTRLEVGLEGKPDKAFVFQSFFTVNASLLAAIGVALVIFRTFIVPV